MWRDLEFKPSKCPSCMLPEMIFGMLTILVDIRNSYQTRVCPYQTILRQLFCSVLCVYHALITFVVYFFICEQIHNEILTVTCTFCSWSNLSTTNAFKDREPCTWQKAPYHSYPTTDKQTTDIQILAWIAPDGLRTYRYWLELPQMDYGHTDIGLNSPQIDYGLTDMQIMAWIAPNGLRTYR